MKLRLLLFFVGLALMGCNQTQDQAPAKVQSEPDWLSTFNTDPGALKGFYHPTAIKVLSDIRVLSGNQAIADYYKKSQLKLDSINILANVVARTQRGIEYDINLLKDSNGGRYKEIVIKEKIDDSQLRVFEFMAAHIPRHEVNLDEITKRRNQWIELCNQHNAANLINELYSPNTLYFNHKPPVIGREALIPVYSYMNNENYNLTLHPEVVEVVNENLVYEIGQCVGSYGGKYLLIWEKDSDGKWYIYVDSNV